jgi:hypothetical protein
LEILHLHADGEGIEDKPLCLYITWTVTVGIEYLPSMWPFELTTLPKIAGFLHRLPVTRCLYRNWGFKNP